MGHVWLIGMMGAGKSSVGSLLSGMIDLPFVDVDEYIVEIAGVSIAELFTSGEETFRTIEHRAISEIAERENHVVATGGGAVLDERNVVTMRNTGTTILLTAGPADLARRLDDVGGRPLLGSDRDVALIAEERRMTYASSADATVDTSGMSTGEVAKEVASCVGM